jgi:predicted ABC-type ATPase
VILFLDTSAFVKLYIVEPGSERMRERVARGGSVAASNSIKQRHGASQSAMVINSLP